jgi:hypothetical protein
VPGAFVLRMRASVSDSRHQFAPVVTKPLNPTEHARQLAAARKEIADTGALSWTDEQGRRQVYVVHARQAPASLKGAT